MLADPNCALDSRLSPLVIAAAPANVGPGAMFLNLDSALEWLFTSCLSAVSNGQYTSWSGAYQ